MTTGGRSVPPLGIASHSVPAGPEPGAVGALQRAHALGLDGCVFMNPLLITPTLEAGALRETKVCADDLGLFLEIGLGRISPYHFSVRGEVLELGDGDFRAGLVRMIQSVREIGCTDLFFWIGSPADRVSRTIPWAEQLAAARAFLASLAPILRDLAVRLMLKTHGEDSTSGMVETVETVGADVLGIAFDPANVCGSLEDPIAATKRVAPYVRQLQTDDLLLTLDGDMLVRQLRPCGQGILDWPAILTILRERSPGYTVAVELHRAVSRMPLFDQSWLALQTHLSPAEYAETIRLLQLSEQRLASGATPPLDRFPTREDRLTSAIAFMRQTLRKTYAAH